MSPLLILAVVLLVLVVALTLWQRRSQVDHTARRDGARQEPVTRTPPAAPRAAAPGPSHIDDPELGTLSFDGERLWEGDSVDFDGVPILAALHGDANGPHPVARQLAVAARSEAKALWARGRAIVAAELARRGVPADDVEPFEVAVDIEDGRAVAFLWYEVDDFDGSIGVSSRDGWKTLTLEVVE